MAEDDLTIDPRRRPTRPDATFSPDGSLRFMKLMVDAATAKWQQDAAVVRRSTASGQHADTSALDLPHLAFVSPAFVAEERLALPPLKLKPPPGKGVDLAGRATAAGRALGPAVAVNSWLAALDAFDYPGVRIEGRERTFIGTWDIGNKVLVISHKPEDSWLGLGRKAIATFTVESGGMLDSARILDESGQQIGTMDRLFRAIFTHPDVLPELDKRAADFPLWVPGTSYVAENKGEYDVISTMAAQRKSGLEIADALIELQTGIKVRSREEVVHEAWARRQLRLDGSLKLLPLIPPEKQPLFKWLTDRGWSELAASTFVRNLMDEERRQANAGAGWRWVGDPPRKGGVPPLSASLPPSGEPPSSRPVTPVHMAGQENSDGGPSNGPNETARLALAAHGDTSPPVGEDTWDPASISNIAGGRASKALLDFIRSRLNDPELRLFMEATGFTPKNISSMLGGARRHIDEGIAALVKHKDILRQIVAAGPFDARSISSMLSGSGRHLAEAIDALVEHQDTLRQIVAAGPFDTKSLSSMLNGAGRHLAKGIAALVKHQDTLREIVAAGPFDAKSLSSMLSRSGEHPPRASPLSSNTRTLSGRWSTRASSMPRASPACSTAQAVTSPRVSTLSSNTRTTSGRSLLTASSMPRAFPACSAVQAVASPRASPLSSNTRTPSGKSSTRASSMARASPACSSV
jgi:hypothetical protein